MEKIHLIFAIILLLLISGCVKDNPNQLEDTGLPPQNQEIVCGDGLCQPSENFTLCPNDCPNTCQNECAQSGIKQCAGTGFEICGNYDEDICFEWNSITTCSNGTTCQNGNCIEISELWNISGVDEQVIKDKMIWNLAELSGFTFGGASQPNNLDLRYLKENFQRSEFSLNLFNSQQEAENYFENALAQARNLYSVTTKIVNGNEINEGTSGQQRTVIWQSGIYVIKGWNGDDIGDVVDNVLFDKLTQEYLKKYPSSDSSPTTTILVNDCSDIICHISQKCVNGTCISKTCSEQSGTICSTNQYCPNTNIAASDSENCCPTACTNTLINQCGNIACASNQKCVNETCITKTCSELGGSACPSYNNTCANPLGNASDTLECCGGTCTPKPTCSSLNGSLCQNTLCEGNYQSTFDTPSNKVCCTGTCHSGLCGATVAQATAQQFYDSLINNNYSQYASIIDSDCSANAAACQSLFESDKSKVQLYTSVTFNYVNESSGSFSNVHFNAILNGQTVPISASTQENYTLGGCRVGGRTWYTP